MENVVLMGSHLRTRPEYALVARFPSNCDLNKVFKLTITISVICYLSSSLNRAILTASSCHFMNYFQPRMTRNQQRFEEHLVEIEEDGSGSEGSIDNTFDEDVDEILDEDSND